MPSTIFAPLDSQVIFATPESLTFNSEYVQAQKAGIEQLGIAQDHIGLEFRGDFHPCMGFPGRLASAAALTANPQRGELMS